MRLEREHFSENTRLNIITKSRPAILVTHHSAINNLSGLGVELSSADYQEKRDFVKTPELQWGTSHDRRHRFVVQKHRARSLHYDFRLEMGGVLRSWAVPKGPPLEPGIRRLAVQVEDHPIDYIDFAGEIPHGEYGAGSVEIWDKGEFNLEKESADILEFSLRGKRLSGSYALIHTDSKNWLFIRRKEM